MTSRTYRVSDAAALIGVSDDTIRRWAAAGRVRIDTGADGVKAIDGAELASLAREVATTHRADELGGLPPASARNRLHGIVTAIVRDTVMAQVDVQAGPFRLVSLISREAADELDLDVGSLVVASVKATNLGIEAPASAFVRDSSTHA